ncbi:Dynamin-like protein, mitochondrial [Nymphon striatum]|nr:Dynamin-like protein, mitochondrial [Nymphon striatum]
MFGRFGFVIKTKSRQKDQQLCLKRLLILKTCDAKRIRPFSSLRNFRHPQILYIKHTASVDISRKFVTSLIGIVARNALKIRYWVVGGAIGGGVQATRKYEDWKDSLPDMKWLQDLAPDSKRIESFRITFDEYKNKLQLPEKGWLTDVMTAAQIKGREIEQWLNENASDGDITSVVTGEKVMTPTALYSISASSQPNSSLKIEKADKYQEDFIQIQIKYQRELERLEKENRELRKQILLKYPQSDSKRKFKKSLIDIYSEVLDELSDYDTNYNTQDHLPRVVVVGDQSSGKTSVLEMIAQARIFPRGSGEMMTRAPVKVTLSEGPYHIARFSHSSREFDLTKESDLEELRREVEIRMKKSVAKGKTVSNQVISMTVKGPGLQRMVLVDLPGIISTVTTDMAVDTKDAIKEMSQLYMCNPNAIILCIQDGSVDAERSNVTDLVSHVDPHGKRTILVLTKVDLAEENLADPARIKKILEGKLFPMKALGNFAVVTGRGNNSDSIQTIKKYEEEYFSNSKLFKDGIISPSQLSTQSLSFAVSECFWKMVKESVEQQADAFKASRFNLETEWKHSFPRRRELDRDELYEKARGQILDEIINLSLISPKQWEEKLTQKLWEKMSSYVFENIFLSAAHCDSPGVFNTTIDIKLKQWAEKILPQKCVEVGWETLKEEFKNLLEKSKLESSHDNIFDNLIAAIVDDAVKSHKWEDKAANMLRVIQLNTLEDRSVTDKQQWDQAVSFLDSSIQERLLSTERMIKEMVGPSFRERWMHWKYKTPEQNHSSSIKQELDKLLNSDYVSHRSPTLGTDEITTVKKNLQTRNLDTDVELIKQMWNPVYRLHFLKKATEQVRECRRGFYMYHQGISDSELDCNAVVLFWRIQRMIHITANTLRQQVMNREARRLEKEIKEVLDDISEDEEKKKQLLTGRRVELAEELKSGTFRINLKNSFKHYTQKNDAANNRFVIKTKSCPKDQQLCLKRLIISKTCDAKHIRSFSSLRNFGHPQILCIKPATSRNALKIRYWVVGGVQATREYGAWKDRFTDMKWLQDLTPDSKRIKSYRITFDKYKNKLQLPEKSWLTDVITAAKIKGREKKQWSNENASDGNITSVTTEEKVMTPTALYSISASSQSNFSLEIEKADKYQEDFIQIQSKHQRELERLKKENRELRKQILLKNPQSDSKWKFKKSLIDIHSEVLDELSDYDTNYNTQDHLPRVVVVGDQSSGKTSVLEMIAQARIFPRGSGEMMTKAPVKVTLSEGPYHIARFSHSSREFDLTKESDLKELRREVGFRMKKSVAKGKAVSNQVISMTVKGPDLQRMVLVDLPGIISTVTTDMTVDTKDAIKEMCRLYMCNSNAIILCIQDGSVDAERSNVTDLVSHVDPHGKRTILVLTKVDLAEENLADPARIKNILEGKLSPMKALGNFAVVTGRGNNFDSIQTIKKYEEEYFSNSKLFKDGIISPSQLSTQSLSFAVSECFWKMVKESVEQQADAFKVSRFNLETEWKHSFPQLRELDRDALYEKARADILDETINLSFISPKQWEEKLRQKLWEKMSSYVFENIFLSPAHCESSEAFNTIIDIKLKQWAENILPRKCVEVGWETLKEEYKNLLEKSKLKSSHDNIFDNVIAAIVEESLKSLKNYKWEEEATNMLRVIQLNTLEDRSVTDKQQWDQAVSFLDSSIQERLLSTEKMIKEMVGPSSFRERWIHWTYKTPEQKHSSAIKQVLDKLLKKSGYSSHRSPTLGTDEVTTVQKNLRKRNLDTDVELIKQMWNPVYRLHFLKKTTKQVRKCRKDFYKYHQGSADSDLDWIAVVLFWRIQRMIQITANTLRQQVMNREAGRLKKEIKEVLDDISENKEKKKQLLTGRRVELAEELKRVRLIQDKLEEFIQALNLSK